MTEVKIAALIALPISIAIAIGVKKKANQQEKIIFAQKSSPEKEGYITNLQVYGAMWVVAFWALTVIFGASLF